MNALQQFTYAGQDVRTVEMDGEHWFALADLCSVLDIANTANVKNRLDPDGVRLADLTDSMGRRQSTTVINEPNMYDVVIRSDKPEAVKFRRWLTGEVLPVLRKTGTYSTTSTHQLPQSFSEALRQLADTCEQLEAVAPKVEAYDALIDTSGLLSMQAAAKALGYGPNIMFRDLRRLGILQGNNLPFQKYAHNFEVKLSSYTNRRGETVPTATTMVRPSGLDFLRRKLTRAAEEVTAAAASLSRSGGDSA